MDEKSFCYWLNGFFEMSEAEVLSKKQVLMIKEHLNLVFNKVTGDGEQSPPLYEGGLKQVHLSDEPVCKSDKFVKQKCSPLVRERRYCQVVSPDVACSIKSSIGFK